MPSPRCILMSFIFGILILPTINGGYGYCTDKFTSWRAAEGGQAVFLDRHTLSCGPSNALRSFKLESSGNYIHYKYKCCNLPKATCSLRQVQNDYIVKSKGNSVYLEIQHVSCGARGLLSAFVLSRNGYGKYRYEYNCCDFNSQSSLHCYDDATLFTGDGGGNVIYLGKQTVKCSRNYFLQSFRLDRNVAHNRVRYLMKCCKVNS